MNPRLTCATCANSVEDCGDTLCLECLAKRPGDYYARRLEAFREQDQGEHPRLYACPGCGVEDNNLLLALHHCQSCGW